MLERLYEMPKRGRCFECVVQHSLFFSVWITDCLSSFTRKAARLGKFQQQKLQYNLILAKMLVCRQIKVKMLSKTSSKKSKWITLAFYHSFRKWRMLLSKS